jgi:CheY-like chemotaxis protein
MAGAPYVLIVEDDPTNRMLATRILSAAGVEFAQAVDGEQALSLLKTRRPDLVLMDLSLPGIDGWEVTRRVRQDPDLRSIPILAVSAHAMAGDRERAIAAGCDDYLTKPYRPAHLIAAVERFTKSAPAGAEPAAVSTGIAAGPTGRGAER